VEEYFHRKTSDITDEQRKAQQRGDWRSPGRARDRERHEEKLKKVTEFVKNFQERVSNLHRLLNMPRCDVLNSKVTYLPRFLRRNVADIPGNRCTITEVKCSSLTRDSRGLGTAMFDRASLCGGCSSRCATPRSAKESEEESSERWAKPRSLQ
jgi:hypothetical protein